MFGEISWTSFDQLVESYAVVTALIDRVPELERQIVQVCESLASARPAMHDFSYVLGARPQSKDEVVRKVAWACQHIYDARAWCVGQKIAFRRNHGRVLASPLISQLQRLGYAPSESVDLAYLGKSWPTSIDRQDKLDAMLVDQKKDIAYLVKGISYSQAKAYSKQLWVNSDRESLFGQDGRFLARIQVKSDAIASLVFAKDVVKAAFPQLEVKCIFLIIDDPESGWSFQAHDVTSATIEDLKASKIGLDQFGLSATHFHFKDRFSADSDSFASLPSWASSNYLESAPVDRPTRGIMLLTELWERQEARPEKLRVIKGADLAEAVQEKYDIEYPTDLWRHDIEDCLERGRFIQRAGNANSFGILPKGVGRVLLIRRKFNPLASLSSGLVLDSVTQQARLWSAAPVI